jgi:hypothetical protein
MANVCCDDLRDKALKECEQHPGDSCPDNVVRYYSRRNVYGIPHRDGSYIRIHYCPWCGLWLEGLLGAPNKIYRG